MRSSAVTLLRTSRLLPLLILALAVVSRAGAVDFIRGDANADGLVNFSDVALLLLAERREDVSFSCLDAADVNDDGFVGDVTGAGSDVARLQDWLVGQWFRIGDTQRIPAPFPLPGPDPTGDRLSCARTGERPAAARSGRRLRWSGPRSLPPAAGVPFELLLEVDTDQPIVGFSLVYLVNLAAVSITGVDFEGTSFPSALRRSFERSELFRWELVSEGRLTLGLLHVQALFVDASGRRLPFAATDARGSRIPLLRVRGETRGGESAEPVPVLVPFTGGYAGDAATVGGARNAFLSFGTSPGVSLPELPILDPDLGDYLPILAGPEEIIFLRGDSNTDSIVNIGDAVYTLNFLFTGGGHPNADDAADANDDGVLNLADPVFTLGALFLGGPSLPPPYPNCGVDETPDTLDCCAYAPCAE